jgi:hypothetical protein
MISGKDLRRRRKRLFFIATLFLPLFVFIGLFSSLVGNFYYHRNLFNLAAEAKDNVLVEQELAALDYYYGLATKWKMRWFADRYLYQEAYIDKAIYDYLIGDYASVISSEELMNHRDNHLIYQLIASSRFRQAEALYKAAETDEEKEKIIELINLEISEDFRMAVEIGPGPNEYFDHTFNYDLAVDPELAKQALEAPGLPRLKLEYKPGLDDESGEEDENMLDPTQPGGGKRSKAVG